MTDQVKDRPGPQRDAARGGPAARDAGRAGEALRSGAGELRDRASGVAEHAKDQGKAALARQKEGAAGEVDSVAGALHETAERLQHDEQSTLAPKIGRYVGYAAQQLEHASRRLRDKDIDTLIDDAAALGRRSPAALFAGAAVAGFLLSRFLKSSATRPHDDDPGRATDGIPAPLDYDLDADFDTTAADTGMAGSPTTTGLGSSDAALLNPAPGSSTAGMGNAAAGSTGGVGGLTSATAQPAVSSAPVVDAKSNPQGERHGQ